MFKILNKIQFREKKSRMKVVADTRNAIQHFKNTKSQNLKYLLEKRYNWMNKYIKENDIGIEVGSGAGFAKYYINNKNFKTTDFSEDEHIDIKKIDALNTGFENNSFDYIICSHMIHHIAYPIKFFKEMSRILKKNGKLIIHEPYCSVLFQLITILMRHEGFNFGVDVWNEDKPVVDTSDRWDGNLAVSNYIFDNKNEFNQNLGNYFDIIFEDFEECLIFLNSGGVTSKTFYIPMNRFFLNILYMLDKMLVKLSRNLFCMGRKIVLKKNN